MPYQHGSKIKTFVIESYGEALDEFVYDSEQDAIDAAELLQIS